MMRLILRRFIKVVELGALSVLVVLLVAKIDTIRSQSTGSKSGSSKNSRSEMLPHPQSQPQMKIAICLTGQLMRLEILSKLRNLIAHNHVYLGHQLDMFVLLDNDVNEVKQTYWRHDYSNMIYRNMTSLSLQMYMEKNLKGYIKQLRSTNTESISEDEDPPSTVIRVSLASPVQANYTILRGKVPVGDKSGPVGEGLPTVGDFEPAAVRFQNNMRWMGGLRSCVKWVQQIEQQQQWFYDIVIRLRDDSFVLGPWVITAQKYQGAFVTAAVASNFGVNDHNFAVDRRWADSVFRGVTEDYYFNETLDMYSWTNTEHRIYKILTSKGIPIRKMDVCEQPVTHLRGMESSSHWRLHPTYSEALIAACKQEQQKLITHSKNPAQTADSGGVLPLKKSLISGLLASYWGKVKVKGAASVEISSPTHSRQLVIESKREEINNGTANLNSRQTIGATATKPCCLPEWLETLNAGKVKVLL